MVVDEGSITPSTKQGLMCLVQGKHTIFWYLEH